MPLRIAECYSIGSFKVRLCLRDQAHAAGRRIRRKLEEPEPKPTNGIVRPVLQFDNHLEPTWLRLVANGQHAPVVRENGSSTTRVNARRLWALRDFDPATVKPPKFYCIEGNCATPQDFVSIEGERLETEGSNSDLRARLSRPCRSGREKRRHPDASEYSQSDGKAQRCTHLHLTPRSWRHGYASTTDVGLGPPSKSQEYTTRISDATRRHEYRASTRPRPCRPIASSS